MVAFNVTGCTYVVVHKVSLIDKVEHEKYFYTLNNLYLDKHWKGWGAEHKERKEDGSGEGNVFNYPIHPNRSYGKARVIDAVEEYLELNIGELGTCKTLRTYLFQNNLNASYMENAMGSYVAILNEYQLQYNPDGTIHCVDEDELRYAV